MFSPYETPHEGAPVIHEGGVSRRNLPANFRADDAPLFEHELERVVPPTLLLELRGVSVSSNGILFKDGKILPESFSSSVILDHFLRRKRSVLKFLAANYALRRRRKIARPALWITDDWSYGYFHWLADALPRLFAARARANELILLLPHGYEQIEFVQSSLKVFALGGVEYVREGEVCVCERLFMPTHTAPSGNYNEALMREMRDFMLDSFRSGERGDEGERIYISRARAPKRKVANEEETVGVLREFGFSVVHSEEYSFEQQARIAYGARHLVSNHGAGLTNMLFMRAGSSVLELRRESERERNWFFNLANAMRLGYFYQTCKQESPGEDAHTANVVVDTERLRENLALMLAAG